MVTGTQLYNYENQPIYPISHSEIIKTSGGISVNNKEYVEDCLVDLYKTIASLKGDEDTVNSIQINIQYCITNSNNESEAKESTSWQNAFVSPTSEFPYTWKKTTFTYVGDSSGGKTVYEIVATDIAEKIQNIYMAMSTTNQPIIDYPILKDENGDPILDDSGNTQEDLTVYDEKLPTGWSETPVSISASTPFVYISTRKRIDGNWQRFSNPAQFGRWAFDSQLELRYKVSNVIPEFAANNDDPGEGWATSSPTEFTGKLWMITATSVNGIINVDDEGVRWKGPNLMSIIQ